MSTPIETNTEQLQEVLQQVYNLPNRSGGGNSYDLTINLSGNYWPGDSYDVATNLTATFEESDLRNIAEKITAGENASVIVRGYITFDSGAPLNCIMHPVFIRATAQDYNGRRTCSVCIAVNVCNYAYREHDLLCISVYDAWNNTLGDHLATELRLLPRT